MLRALAPFVIFLLAGCASGFGTPQQDDVDLIGGPPMSDIVTQFDAPLACLKGKVPSDVTFGVGVIADSTGKEQYNDSGTGKIISQGAGDMVQSALFRAGVTVVNRRDPNIPLAEGNWGIRDLKLLTPVNFFVTGSITSLDFIPGGGAEVRLAGVGPKYRENRVLIGLDLALTEANSGRVVANISISKQLYESETGFDANRFQKSTLVDISVGGIQREALQFTLRKMLSYATFDLLAQVINADAVAPCVALIPADSASVSDMAYSGDGAVLARALEVSRAAEAAREEKAAATAEGQPANGQPAVKSAPVTQADGLPTPGMGAATGSSKSTPPAPTGNATPADGQVATTGSDALSLARQATSFAAQAIASAANCAQATNFDEAKKACDDADAQLAKSITAIKAAAAAGLSGPEGDAAAMVVKQAMNDVSAARRRLDGLAQPPSAGAGDTLTAPAQPNAKDTGKPTK